MGKNEKMDRENLIINNSLKRQGQALALANSFSGQFKGIQKSLNVTLEATRCMQNLTESFKKISFPNIEIDIIKPFIKQIQLDSKKFAQISKTQEWASKLGGLAEISNLSKLALSIPELPILKIPLDEITPTIINQSKNELEYFSENLNTDGDPVYNFQAYEVLFNLEVSLRKIINERIIKQFPKELNNKIGEDTLKIWEEREKKEKNNNHVDNIDYHLIEYSDFTHLKDIFNKGRNKNLFLDLVSEEDLKTITSKLHELDPIRKKIAHSRMLSLNEFEKIKMYYDNIIKILFSKEKQK
jgi:hypothetical protein